VVRELAFAAGANGLITGQALDLAAHADDVATDATRLALVERIHDHKTARLIAASMVAGAIVAGAGGDAIERMRRAGTLAGSAFQITDDLLDSTGDARSLGKTPRKDEAHRKLTFPAVAGAKAAQTAARERVERALQEVPEAASAPLARLIRFVAERRS
jgi:geranylgeranyl diphosphate synthase type II